MSFEEFKHWECYGVEAYGYTDDYIGIFATIFTKNIVAHVYIYEYKIEIQVERYAEISNDKEAIEEDLAKLNSKETKLWIGEEVLK